jgi:shikimate kinase / 3-dehydroquinate synthase
VIVLTGFMGAGKSTIGAALANALDIGFFDSDRAIVEREGISIAEIFARHGEDGFRRIEADVVLQLLENAEGVVALGGGAVVTPQVRSALGGHVVVFLEIDVATARARISRSPESRPLADGDLDSLFEARLPLYRGVATLTVPDSEVPDIVKRLVVALRDMRSVRVDVAHHPYPVVIGNGTVQHLDLFTGASGADKALVVSHPSLGRYSAQVRAALTGQHTELLEVPEGETTKSMEVAAGLLEEMAARSLHRNDLVVTVGGGVVTDLGGYVASIYNRGIRVLHVPTTLLGQVDAAIGGKTGVNLSRGKNLVGTFHQPESVVCDVGVLESLPQAELVSGLAEVVKYGLISEPAIIEHLSAHHHQIVARHPAPLMDMVEASVRVKAKIVAADERESGQRAFLNYGHTFAHAFEVATGYSMRHGEAVSLGMMAAAYASRELGWIDDSFVDLHRRTLHDVGLPVRAGFKIDDLDPVWRLDKKYSGGVRFVLLRGPAEPQAGVLLERNLLERVLERLAG